MSWHYSAALGADFSLQDYLDGLRSVRSRSKSTLETWSCKDRRTDVSMPSPSGPTLLTSMAVRGGGSSMLSVEDFLAKTSAPQVRVKDLPVLVQGYGSSILESLKKCGLVLSSRKTRRNCELVASAPSSKVLPAWGMTCDGACWELGTSAEITSETECGYLPTPTASQYGNNRGGAMGRTGKVRHSLESMAKNNMWPTPKASAAGPDLAKADRSNTGISLQTAVAMWPTPKSSDGSHGGPNQRGSKGDLALPAAATQWPTPTVKGNYNREGVSGKSGDGLATAVVKCPTPSANDWKGSSKEGQRRRQLTDPAMGVVPAGGQLNPNWVEWLMGWPIGWTESKPLEMDRFRWWQLLHGISYEGQPLSEEKKPKTWREKRQRKEIIVSASQFETATLCIRKWWLLKVRKLIEKSSVAQVFGDVLHAVIERFLLGGNTEAELYPKGWENSTDRWSGKVSGAVDPADQALIKKLITEGIKEGVIHREPNGRVEREFKREMLKHRDVSVKVTGFIDYELPGEIQDHKSAKNTKYLKTTRKGGNYLGSNLQMLLYGGEHLIHLHERGLDLPDEVRLRHNQFVKNPDAKGRLIVRKTSVPVSIDDINVQWETCEDMAKKMVDLRFKAEKWDDCPDPKEPQKACNAYGGCAFMDICTGRITEKQYEKRMEKNSKKPYTSLGSNNQKGQDRMSSLKDKLAKKNKGGGAAAAEAPVNPEPDAAPPAEENPSAGYVHEGDTPPWADPECKACEGKGFNTKGNACAICNGTARKNGDPSAKDFISDTDKDGNVTWVLKGSDAAPETQPTEAAAAPVEAQTSEADAPAEKGGSLKDKLKKGKKNGGIGGPSEPAEAPAEEPAEAPSEEPAAKPKGKGGGRPKKSFMLLIDCVAHKGLQKKGSGRAIYYLDDVIAEYGSQMAKDNGKDSFYELGGFDRRDALCAAAPLMVEDFGADMVLCRSNTAEARQLIEALRPFAGTIVEAVSA